MVRQLQSENAQSESEKKRKKLQKALRQIDDLKEKAQQVRNPSPHPSPSPHPNPNPHPHPNPNPNPNRLERREGEVDVRGDARLQHARRLVERELPVQVDPVELQGHGLGLGLGLG